MMKRYRSVLITGASGGIGSAFARLLAPFMESMLITGRNLQALQKLAEEIKSPASNNIHIKIADLTKQEDVNQLAVLAGEKKIDLFINNAGFGHFNHFLATSPRGIIDMLQVNVLAATQLLHILLPGMIERATVEKRAGVICVASMAAFMPIPYFSAYAASKSYLHTLVLGLQQELGQQPIDLLSLCPGLVETAFITKADMPRKLLKRAANPQVIAQTAMQKLGNRDQYTYGFGNQVAMMAGHLLPSEMKRKLLYYYCKKWLLPKNSI